MYIFRRHARRSCALLIDQDSQEHRRSSSDAASCPQRRLPTRPQTIPSRDRVACQPTRSSHDDEIMDHEQRTWGEPSRDPPHRCRRRYSADHTTPLPLRAWARGGFPSHPEHVCETRAWPIVGVQRGPAHRASPRPRTSRCCPILVGVAQVCRPGRFLIAAPVPRCRNDLSINHDDRAARPAADAASPRAATRTST